METQKLHEQKAPKKAQSQQPRQSLSMGIPRQSLGTSKLQTLADSLLILTTYLFRSLIFCLY